MHQPGYVQGGQEVGRGYLLLGIHYRRIREHSTLFNFIRIAPETVTQENGKFYFKLSKLDALANTVTLLTQAKLLLVWNVCLTV
jgi:hypothetical protein